MWPWTHALSRSTPTSGRAEDTGGLTKGKHIDLSYDEGQSDRRTAFTDAYLLGPVLAEFPLVLDGIGPVEKF